MTRAQRNGAGSSEHQPLSGTDRPRFLVVGTPRSGTTLVQRLASELDGVRLPPETHFFTDFLTVVLRRWRFPLRGPALREALEEYAARPYLQDIPFDVDSVMTDLGGSCASALDLFDAIVRHLAGPASLLGEKTPGHLLWWRPLTRARSDLKVVAVIRDPRAVVASWLEVGWGPHHVRAAHRWSSDARRLLAASKALGPERLLVVRYEHLVVDPSASRAQLAAFLGPRGSPLATADPDADVSVSLPEWEHWKAEASGPIDPTRVDRWRRSLTPDQADDVRAICRVGMAELGYDDVPSRPEALRRRATFAPGVQMRRLRLGARRRWRDAEIERIGRSSAFS